RVAEHRAACGCGNALRGGRAVRAMKVVPDPLGRRLLSLYHGAPPAVRAHVGVRWATCPFRAVVAELPGSGAILEVGCGHGLLSLYLALSSPARRVTGIDVDGDKLEAARAAAARGGLAAAFEAAKGADLPDGPWDGIAIVDVLYLLGADDQRSLLGSCAGALAPGGVLAVKEMAPEPRWKARWNVVQETAAVKLLGITEGEELTFLPPLELATAMTSEGLEVRERPVHKGYPHPHHLLVGRRPR
ncbi:MAG: class I SAM-dependent methyltransferase, partial [Actinomycetota bacterium]|nr:class I SAM-dependent methyltransferase [Actinomycetota bacterium]